MADWWSGYIRQAALMRGLDPQAVLAVANVEGLSGAVGDQGTSFGPFQLHVGGALPRGKGRAWAESKEGINYALDQIAGVAKGLKGQQAIAAIVTHFERPADPRGEIGRATGVYGKVPAGSSNGRIPGSGPGGGGSTPSPAATPGDLSGFDWQSAFKANLQQTIAQQSLQLAQTGDVNAFSQGLLGAVNQRQAYQAAAARFGPLPPNSPPDGGPGVPVKPADTKGVPGAGWLAPAGGKIIGVPNQGTHTIGNWESDNAIDVAMPVGTPLRATADGVIGDQFGSLGTSGRFQGLRLHLVTNGDEFYYAHLSKYAPGIKPGTHVKRGQIIGYSGEANGVAHLHLGTRSGNPLSLYK